MTRKIMMRKYGLDEGNVYVEQSTMLEPNNFIPSWEAGDEEKKEVSTALRKLRVEYDIIHKKKVEKIEALDLLKVSQPPAHPAQLGKIKSKLALLNVHRQM